MLNILCTGWNKYIFESITRNLHNKSHTLIKGKREQKENVK